MAVTEVRGRLPRVVFTKTHQRGQQQAHLGSDAAGKRFKDAATRQMPAGFPSRCRRRWQVAAWQHFLNVHRVRI